MGNTCPRCTSRGKKKRSCDVATMGDNNNYYRGVAASVEGSNPLVKKIREKSEFETTLKESKLQNKLLIADFYALWCGPCQLVSPRVDQFSNEFVDKAIFAKINVDDNDELASAYSISCTPTFIIFAKGEKVDEISGANVDKLRELIGKHYDEMVK